MLVASRDHRAPSFRDDLKANAYPLNKFIMFEQKIYTINFIALQHFQGHS